MKTMIYKYTVEPFTTELDLPVMARALAVGVQGEDVVIWYEVNPDAMKRKRVLRGVMTGGSPPPAGVYVGTVQRTDGIVVHVYEEKL